MIKISASSSAARQERYPVLYSFRRCPYAMRARMGLLYAGITVELREVVLKSKPKELLALSQKATVPVLQKVDGSVLDESLDILNWALSQQDPDGWQAQPNEICAAMQALIFDNDFSFKKNLDGYKYAGRSNKVAALECRTRGEIFLQRLELMLTEPLNRALLNDEHLIKGRRFLFGERISTADIAIFPFVRQFSKVDEGWFSAAPYPNLQRWLDAQINSELFLSVMKKYPVWSNADQAVLF
ncbi:MAG: glutathione S-transferase [Pseudomonadales bacterium]|nr:glutathione S-transferase [Pseudomonadales bacterium]